MLKMCSSLKTKLNIINYMSLCPMSPVLCPMSPVDNDNPPHANSSTMHSRLIQQDKNSIIFWGHFKNPAYGRQSIS